MINLIVTILSVLFMGSSLMAAPSVEVGKESTQVVVAKKSMDETVGFKDWKQKRVFQARAELDSFKTPQNSPTESSVENSGEKSDSQTSENNEESENQTPKNPKLEARAEKLRQLEFNLEIAQGLTIHDYFALYLKDKSKEQMSLAITKLSSDELSELLMAYRSSLYGVPVNAKSEKNQINQNL